MRFALLASLLLVAGSCTRGTDLPPSDGADSSASAETASSDSSGDSSTATEEEADAGSDDETSSSDEGTTAGETDDGTSSSGDGTDTGPVCGNGIAESGEDCDGEDLESETCVGLGWAAGELGCTKSCVYDTSACTDSTCGNGIVDEGEQCDGLDLNGFDCGSLGYVGGDLHCDPVTCTYDTSWCTSA